MAAAASSVQAEEPQAHALAVRGRVSRCLVGVKGRWASSGGAAACTCSGALSRAVASARGGLLRMRCEALRC